MAELSRIYGRHNAHTIIENCWNTVILRCSAGAAGGTSRLAAELIGQREVMRTERSRGPSYTPLGSGEDRTVETVTSRPVIEYAVLPSEIEELPDRAGFLTVASRPGWRRVTFMA